VGRGGKVLFVIHIFGDKEVLQKECPRAILLSPGHNSKSNWSKGKCQERETEDDKWDFDLLPNRVCGIIF